MLGTLHTGDTLQSITRILDVVDAELQNQLRTQLAQSLQTIVSQRLLRRADGEGIVVATEILIATRAVRSIIRLNRLQELPSYLETGRPDGMRLLEQSVEALVTQGMVETATLREMTPSQGSKRQR